ncbi:MAG: hypothetical protein JST00_12745 [Deltaproteobacteria bacterium]|nr:hypothetical protein [Deltaproteobacteria bacterium]
MSLKKIALTIALAGLPLAARAAPPAKGPSGGSAAAKACVAAHEEALSLRTQKKLHASRERFVACARSECPTVVRKECVEQLALVEKSAPTVALEAHDDKGNDTADVKVTVDGAPFAERLSGTAMNVEPGEHVFRFERSSDGKVIEQKVLVVEGDKNRKVIADYAALLPKPLPAPLPAAPAPVERRSVPAIAYVSGGVALAGFGVFAGFALVGKGAEKDLANTCSPRCTDDQLSPVKRDYLVADIGLAVGVVAAVAAVILAWPALTGQPAVTTPAARSRAPAPWMPRVKGRTP